jgi:hypothetical protein
MLVFCPVRLRELYTEVSTRSEKKVMKNIILLGVRWKWHEANQALEISPGYWLVYKSTKRVFHSDPYACNMVSARESDRKMLMRTDHTSYDVNVE